MTIKEQKQALRKQMLQERAGLDPLVKSNYDAWLRAALWKRIVDKKYQNVHCYLPMGTEIDIAELIQKMLEQGLTVVTPKTLPKRRLEHLILQSLDALEEGVYGTSHPANAPTFSGQYDLIIVPGLAFDASNYRLGYGGGYYDHFLLQHPGAERLGIFYPWQQVEQVPVEAHDLSLDGILVPPKAGRAGD